jgi:hypothetical protein
MPLWVFLIIIVVVVAGIFFALYFVGKRLEKRQAESQAQMQAAAQTVSILVIDKKKMKMKDAGLPKVVLDQTPRYMRGSKVPVVKAKIGPKVMSLISDPKVYDIIPVKKEVKAVISGIYIMEVKGLRGNLEPKKEKKSFFKRVTGVLKKEK